ncbi:JNK-interacting protein 3 isoform X1 [Vespa velutina]|uniref:JNK-interacting protein 3 isoform X1 n=1 Tax=Vespa velutina TaxID=202808 RepID=UPI001FB41DD5|nr:JNK-interacting protein 3 isoform X1 [Vespa velutina]XP_047352797.1 JNK-interacting protein 3 isoform X1 [Vespa velutina]XP_047352798.1 JNK-interacting protein 3 isoform X1 [Vespa velutina]XP_047352800.1 JNK-interacting protein 3 isoform X1 [Vespa velutina]XP_047352801.1 JNK-interacting protein 3 isoform X1 [Vespa velutina]XP_047352802.1 JNK-interacting protein 3 isoform X1 [Vespa velutina]
MDQETVYGTHEDSHVVMSEKVQSLAGSIYQEFEKMIARYDEDVVKDLMPLLVNVLECLDVSYTENQEREVELELLREDNEQLVTQYEREKQLRKTSDQKLLEQEDVAEDERKELLSRIDSLESIVRMLELKTKNSQDHVVRLEEKETELKREYARLHDRYTELFKTHVDYMERTKMLVGSTERLENATGGRGPSRLPSLGLAHMSRSSGPLSYGFQSLEASINAEEPQDESPPNAANLRTEMLDSSSEAAIETSDKSQLTDQPEQENKTTAISRHESPETELPPPLITPTTPSGMEKLATTPSGGRSKTEREQRSGNTLYQELSFQDADALGEMDEGADITGSWVHPGEYASSVNDNFYGMGKEVENLIMENNELLATKNALNVVKDDLIVKVDELTSEQEILREEVRGLQQTKDRLRQRVAALEEELKKVKEDAEAVAKAAKSDDEEDVPLAQRKRFTRVEMARVLMERNQYKERFMELQEAVRWTEIIRANKIDPSNTSGGKGSQFWKFFSSLFTTTDRGNLVRGTHTLPHIRYSAPTNQVVPAVSTMRKHTLKNRHDFLDQGDTISSEKLVARRANERREQYRQVRAHVRKEDGRLQAYGWSLPGKPIAPVRQPVPVPVYCRPLQETEPGMKIWCGAGVNLTGGKTPDGGCMIGGSVFYAAEASETNTTKTEAEDAIEHLDNELQENEQRRLEAEQLEQKLSSLVWICTSTQKMSKVTVIDANNPADILEVFSVCQGHLLSIASVPGAMESDYPKNLKENLTYKVNNKNGDNIDSNHDETIIIEHIDQNEQKKLQEATTSIENNKQENGNSVEEQSNETLEKTKDMDQSSSAGPQSLESVDSETANLGKVYFIKCNSEVVNDELNCKEDKNEEDENKEIEESTPIEKMSSIQPTMWLGAQNGAVFVHSAVAKWSVCLHFVKLKDAAVAIVHVQGRVLVALADGTVALFRRGPDGQWDLSQYHVITLGSPQHSIRCMTAVSGKTVWCGYRNKIHVIDPIRMTVECTVDAHPRRESQVRQLAWLGEGVWVSIRLDSTLRLYHAHTYQHLQDVDIEPYVSKMLGTGKLGFSFVRITALLISSNRLWIGTGNGVIISVPLSESAGGSMAVSRVQTGANKGDAPGIGVRVFASERGVAVGSFIPYCSMAHAQLSFHGHRDAVKMFVAVPGHGGQSAATDGSQPAMLVLSGGEGYIDFRVGDGEETEESIERSNAIIAANADEHGEQSHLIVWQVQCPIPMPS